MPKAPTQLRSFDAVQKVVQDLLGPDGCPWDKEQTPKSLTQFAIEEAFELAEAIEKEDQHNYIEELGDVLLQVVLHSAMAERDGRFSFLDVCEHLSTKLVTRHPHVYGDVKVSDSTEVLKNWEQLKKLEKEKLASTKKSGNVAQSNTKNPFGIPMSLPALQKAAKLGEKAKKESFDWGSWQEVMEKLDEEIEEFKVELRAHENAKPTLKNQTTSEKAVLDQSVNSAQPLTSELERVQDEMGDVFFVLAQVARKLKLDPEAAARGGNRKFENRFSMLLEYCQEQKISLKDLSNEEKERLWQQIKVTYKNRKN